MAYALRAYYEQENNFATTDRVEIYEDGFSGTAIELGGSFSFEHREITSEGPGGILNVHDNQIMMGVLDFSPRIDTSAKKTLISDISDADPFDFQVRLVRDGTTVWYGYPSGRVFSYPERPSYFAKLQFKDFEILQTQDFPLEDNRQHIITTLADLLSYTQTSQSIYTVTSFQEENTTLSDDFLNQVYHDTVGLREYGSSGDEDDTPITVYEALLHAAEPVLLIKQWDGFRIDQLSGYADPSSVLQSEYNASGVQQSSSTVDVRQTINDSAEDAKPWMKVSSNNDTYPSVHKAKVFFNHRTSESGIQVPSIVTLQESTAETGTISASTGSTVVTGSGTSFLSDVSEGDTIWVDQSGELRELGEVASITDNTSLTLTAQANYTVSGVGWHIDAEETGRYSQEFSSDGTQRIRLATTVRVTGNFGTTQIYGRYRIRSGSYWYNKDTDGWTNSGEVINEFRARGTTSEVSGSIALETSNIPDAADGTLELTLFIAEDQFDSSQNVDVTTYEDTTFAIRENTAAGNSNGTEHELTQSGGFDTYDFGEDWYGDGVLGAVYLPANYRHGTGTTDVTEDSWRRRGESTYIGFHELKLREVIDFQRSRARKIYGQAYGEINPNKVGVYDSNSYFYVSGVYDGRWQPRYMKINEQTSSSDDYISRLRVSSSGSTSSSSSTVGSGGLTESEGDDIYLRLDASNDPVSGGIIFDIGTDEFRIRDGSAMFVVDGASGQIGLGAEPLDDVGLLLDTPARAVTDNTDYDRLKVTNSGALTIAASTTSPIVATAQFDEPNINLASGAAVTNAATVYIESAPTEGDDNWALYAPSGATGLESLFINGTEFVDSARNVSAKTLEATGSSVGGYGIETSSSGAIFQRNSFVFFDLKVPASGSSTDRFRFNWDGSVVTLRNVDTSSNIEIRLQGDTRILSADLTVDDTLTINSQLLFTAGNEQLLSTDASPTFAGGTFNGNVGITGSSALPLSITAPAGGSSAGIRLRITGTSDISFIQFGDDDSVNIGEIKYDHSSDSFKFDINGIDNEIEFTSGGGATFSGDVEVQENLFVEGGLFAKEFTVDTTRVFLSSRFGSGGVVGEIVDATVGSEQIKFVDQDGNAIVPFADNDLLLIQQRTGVNSGTIVKRIKRKVVADSQPSNVVSLTTSGVTTGTDVGTIAVGDQAVLDGNTTDTDRDSFIAVDVLDRDVAAFGFFDNQTDFGNGTEVMRVGGMEPGGTNEYDSSLTGDIGIAGKIGGSLAFALTEDEGLIGGIEFDNAKLWTGDGTNGYVGLGATSGATDRAFWAGGPNEDGSDSGGTSPTFYVQQDGEVFYAGIGGSFYEGAEASSASDGGGELTIGAAVAPVTSVSSFSWNYIEATRTTAGSTSERRSIFATTFRQRFGWNTLVVNIAAGRNNSGANVDSSRTNRVYVTIDSAEGGGEVASEFVAVSTDARTKHEVEIDLTGLTVDDLYSISVEPYAEVSITTSDGNQQVAQTECSKYPILDFKGS